MLKKFIALLVLFLLTVLLIYSFLFYQNNYGSQSISLNAIKTSHQASLQWLLDNEEKLLNTHNPALWEMIRKTIAITNSTNLNQLLLRYQEKWRNQYYGAPLEFQIYGKNHANYADTDLSIFPDYNIFMMYGFSCDNSLKQLATIEDQKSIHFCKTHHPISPACKTHQLMGFIYLASKKCEDKNFVSDTISYLVNSICKQLWWDIRTVDVYLQRVMLLLETGNSKRLRPQWITNIINAQNEDGGWDDFMPLIKIGGNNYFGLGSKFFEFSVEKSDFHATIQGSLLTAYLLEKIATNSLSSSIPIQL